MSGVERSELWGLYHEVELPLSFILAKMEQSGVLLDEQVLDEIGRELDERILALTAGIYELAGEEFNINFAPGSWGQSCSKNCLARGKNKNRVFDQCRCPGGPGRGS